MTTFNRTISTTGANARSKYARDAATDPAPGPARKQERADYRELLTKVLGFVKPRLKPDDWELLSESFSNGMVGEPGDAHHQQTWEHARDASPPDWGFVPNWLREKGLSEADIAEFKKGAAKFGVTFTGAEKPTMAGDAAGFARRYPNAARVGVVPAYGEATAKPGRSVSESQQRDFDARFPSAKRIGSA